MCKKLAGNALHYRKAPELVSKATSRCIPEHVALPERYAILHEPSIVEELDQAHNNATPVSNEPILEPINLQDIQGCDGPFGP